MIQIRLDHVQLTVLPVASCHRTVGRPKCTPIWALPRRRISELVTDNRPALTRQPYLSHPSRTPRCRMQSFSKKASLSVTLASLTLSPLHRNPTNQERC